MKALIQKDLRENLKVALIGLLVFSLLLLSAYQSSVTALTNLLRGSWSGQANVLQPLLSTSLLTETAFFCGIFGAALGWLQTRNEAHRDLWAFLIHRPLTRTEIFWSKSIAGLCLYIFGAGLPLLALVLVVRTPGRVATPFEWEMALPVLMIFLTGLAYYFAGLLTGLRQARWFVSRAFGLVPAILASFSLFGVPEYWMALIPIALATAILATAAWGAYQSGGWYLGQPVAGKLALVVTLTTACMAVLSASLGLAFNLVLDPLSKQSFTYRNYQMTRDGTIYQVTTQDGDIMGIVDLDGHPLLDPKTGQRMDRKEFQKNTTYGVTVSTLLKERKSYRNAFNDAARFFTIASITDKTLWYMDRYGKLTGYDGRTRQSVGSLEAHGFDGSAASEPFLPRPHAGYYSYYSGYNDVPKKWLASARTVYSVDFKERTVTPVFTVTNHDDEIGGYESNLAYYQETQARHFFFTTRTTVQLLDSEGRSLLNVPYQPGYAKYPQVEISVLAASNHYAVWFYPDYQLNDKAHWTIPTHVQWLGADQAVTKSVELPVLHESWVEPLSSKLLSALLPPMVHVEFNGQMLKSWNLLSYALAVISAIIGWRLVRRHDSSTKVAIGWTLFVLVLGLPGLLTLLVVQEWPVREACPQCSKQRSVDREACEHCAATFAPPQKNGTEIFAPLVKI